MKPDPMSGPSAGVELLVPAVSDVILKYTWHIKKYSRATTKRDSFDSPAFDLNANGFQTRWSMSIRYWKGPEGKRVTNPVVLCLNLLSSAVSDEQQARVRFQFGVWNAELHQWEMCTLSRVAMQLQCSKDMLSVGYRDLSILPRHLDGPKGDVALCVKLQLIPAETERHSLAQDLGRLLDSGDIVLVGDGGREFQAHSTVLAARSTLLAAMLPPPDGGNRLEVPDMDPDILQEVLRYMYTDKVDNLDTQASTLLAAAERLRLPGLKVMCEHSLVETITADSVASLLLVADQFHCEALKRTALAYCEDNAPSIKKSLAWKVMEVVNPDLFMEVCEAGLGSSISSNLDSLPSDPDVNGL